MFIAYLVILISINKNKKEKQLRIRSKESSAFSNNRTFIINKKTTSAITCPQELVADTGNCLAAKKGVGSVLATSPYSKNNFETAVNNYITECTTSACGNGCSAVIGAKDFTTVPSSFATDFIACGGPSPVVTQAVGTCAGTEVDTPTTCEANYQIVLTKTTTTASPWVATDVETAINNFITSCAKTSCKTGCSNVISAKNVATEYAGLKTDFTAQCNPSGGSGNTNTGRGIKLFKVTTSLIVMTIGVCFIQFLYPQ
jgi:hypothetical protein